MSDNIADLRGQSFPEAHEPKDYDPREVEVDEFDYHPDTGQRLGEPAPLHQPEPEPEPEPSEYGPWDDIAGEFVVALGEGFDANNDARQTLGLPELTTEHFDRVLRGQGEDALRREYAQMGAQTERLQARIAAGERRPLTQEEKDLAAVTGMRPDRPLTGEDLQRHRYDSATSAEELYRALEADGALMPSEHQGGPNDGGYYA